MIEIQKGNGEIVNLFDLEPDEAEDAVIEHTTRLMSRVNDSISLGEALRQCFRLGTEYGRGEDV